MFYQPCCVQLVIPVYLHFTGLKLWSLCVSSRIQLVALEFLPQIVALVDLLLFQLELHGISSTSFFFWLYPLNFMLN